LCIYGSPKGEGTGILAPFSLGRRVGDEGKSSLPRFSNAGSMAL